MCIQQSILVGCVCIQQSILVGCVAQVFSIFGSHLSTVRSLAAEKREHRLYSGNPDPNPSLSLSLTLMRIDSP